MKFTGKLRGWHIVKNVKPIPDRRHDYDFYHDNYDGADGGNGLAGTAPNARDAIKQIIEIINDKEGSMST